MGTRSGLGLVAEEVLLQYVKAFRDVVNTEEGFKDFQDTFGSVNVPKMAFGLVETATDKFKESIGPKTFSGVMLAIVLADVIFERIGDPSENVEADS
jgi:hypothetical protein